MTENLGSELNVRAPTLKTVTSATRIQVTMYESARSFALIMIVMVMIEVMMVFVRMIIVHETTGVIFLTNVRFVEVTR